MPLPARKQEIPKDGGKVRILSIPAIRDRVVQGALKLILEPIFEADLQPGSFGYRPKRTAHDAVDRVARAIVQQKTRIIDIDLRSYFDNVRHDRLLAKVARRVDDMDVLHLLKIMLKANGKQGVPQGGVISPLLSNLYLTEVDRMLERAKETTRYGKYTYIEYARFADDLVILIDAHPRHDWLMGAVEKRLREELAELQVEINEEKSWIADLSRRELRLSGIRLPTCPQSSGHVVCATHTKAQETNGAAAEAQGCIPPLPIATCGLGHYIDQSRCSAVGWSTLRWDIPASASASLKTGWKRRSGAIWCEPGNERASAGSSGVGNGCTKSLRLFNGYKVRWPDAESRPSDDKSHNP